MAYIDEWRRWHAARVEALAAPYGPLSAMCGLRVRNWASSRAVDGVRALRPADRPEVARHSWARLLEVAIDVADTTRAVDSLTPQQRVLIEAEGVFALDASADRISQISFAGLEVFDPHHDWVVPATIVELSEHEAVRVLTPCSDGHDRAVVLDVVIRFEIDGCPFELRATREPQGAFHAVFTDATRVDGFPFRNIHVPAPDVEDRTTIDFNRAVLPLAALSTRFPSVSAPLGNHLDVPIDAGEHRPYLADASTQAQLA